MTNYSKGWRHFDVTRPKSDGRVRDGHLMYSMHSNSFGDQIIHYRRYQFIREDEMGNSLFGFVTYHAETNQEGSWIPPKMIIETAKRMAK